MAGQYMQTDLCTFNLLFLELMIICSVVLLSDRLRKKSFDKFVPDNSQSLWSNLSLCVLPRQSLLSA